MSDSIPSYITLYNGGQFIYIPDTKAFSISVVEGFTDEKVIVTVTVDDNASTFHLSYAAAVNPNDIAANINTAIQGGANPINLSAPTGDDPNDDNSGVPDGTDGGVHQ